MSKFDATNSVIICTRNRLKDLLVALQSICMQTVLPDEIIIVDSSDIAISKENFPKINLIYKHTSPGLTKQRNEAIDLASGEILYFFDDDVELEPNYIEEMQKIFEKNPE